MLMADGSLTLNTTHPAARRYGNKRASQHPLACSAARLRAFQLRLQLNGNDLPFFR
jgi:hypothetical protein